MGWKWEVAVWARLHGHGAFEYRISYVGDSLILALLAMRAGKREHGAVRLVWRPRSA